MSATLTEAEVIAEGRALLAAAQTSVCLVTAETVTLATDLHDALELYRDLSRGVIHPGSVWPDLEHEDDTYDIALRRAAEDVRADSEALAAALPSLAGTEVAA